MLNKGLNTIISSYYIETQEDGEKVMKFFCLRNYLADEILACHL